MIFCFPLSWRTSEGSLTLIAASSRNIAGFFSGEEATYREKASCFGSYSLAHQQTNDLLFWQPPGAFPTRGESLTMSRLLTSRSPSPELRGLGALNTSKMFAFTARSLVLKDNAVGLAIRRSQEEIFSDQLVYQKLIDWRCFYKCLFFSPWTLSEALPAQENIHIVTYFPPRPSRYRCKRLLANFVCGRGVFRASGGL